MLTAGGTAKVHWCNLCGETSYTWLQFSVLEGDPCICDRCVAERLGLGRLPYKAAVVQDMSASQARAQRPSWWRRLFRRQGA